MASQEQSGSCCPHTSIVPVQEYYGKTLQSSADLKTSACIITARPRQTVAEALRNVHETVKNRFYGCGSPIPDILDGITVLDLGCGSGRDCYVLSQLVGPKGRVIGVDATEEQITVAQNFVAWHKEKFGYENVEFKHGRIEDLSAHGIADDSIDLVISNCVLNLVSDKPKVLKSILRVLKPGGELYFSDICADRRIPASYLGDPILRGECLAGAWYPEDLRRGLSAAGCHDYRVVSNRNLTIQDPAIAAKLGDIKFTSETVRAFKLDLEDRCEDYGQAVMYRGGIQDSTHNFTLDQTYTFQRGKATPVCGNTADMLSSTRYEPYFTVMGDKSFHFGLFDSPIQKDVNQAPSEESACC